MKHSSNGNGDGARIMLVEDDPSFALSLSDILELTGFRTRVVGTAAQALAEGRRDAYDAYVVDVGLPDESGVSLCQALKESSPRPVIVISGNGRDHHASAAAAGADDYLAKPLRPLDLVQILRARIEQNGGSTILKAGDLELNATRREARLGDEVLELTPREFDLLHYLMLHAGDALRANDLLRDVWGWSWTGDPRTLQVHVHTLRKKIDPPSGVSRITTLRGVGYRFEP